MVVIVKITDMHGYGNQTVTATGKLLVCVLEVLCVCVYVCVYMCVCVCGVCMCVCLHVYACTCRGALSS